MSDSGGDADFTLRLKNDVSGPAGAAKKSVNDLIGAFGDLRSASDKAQAKVDANWKKMMAAAKNGMAKEHGTAAQKGLKEQLAFAKQLAKDKERASLLAGKQAARNANIQSGIEKRQKKHADHFYQAKSDHHGDMLEGLADIVKTDGLYALGAAATAAAAAIGFIGYEFIKNAEAASEFGQSSIKAIGYLTDEAPMAEGLFNDVRTEAQGLGLSVEDTVGSFQKLLAAQFSVGQSKELIKMGADMQAIGADAEHVQRILYAMSEIKSMGTLQKRQERMLQMAGISGQLIDQALMKRMNIKTKGGLDMARKKNKIGADVAVEAIKDAVMMKTHESHLGERGKQNADTTLRGMRGQASAGIENFFIDVGTAIEPVLSGLAMHAKDLVLKIANDPKLVHLGEFLLLKWEYFGAWVDAYWPGIESMLITGLHGIVDTVQSGFTVWQEAMDNWDDIKLVLEGLAVGMGVVAGLGLVLLAPFLLAGVAIGGAFVALAGLVGYVVELGKTLYNDAKDAGMSLVEGLVLGIVSMIPIVGPAVAGLGYVAIKELKSSVHSNSPSKDAMEVGDDFGVGYAIGVEGTKGAVKQSSVGLGGVSLDSAIKGSNVSLSGASLDSPSSKGDDARKIVFAPQYQIHQQPGQDGEELAKTVTTMVYGHFASFMDGLASEGASQEV